SMLCWGIQGSLSKSHTFPPTFTWHSELELGVAPYQICVNFIGGVPQQQPCRNTPWPLAFGHSFVSISPGRQHTCALAGSGQAYCFGDNSASQLGNGTFAGYMGGPFQTSDPQPVTQFESFSQIAAGDYHTCAIDGSTGDASCWGSNSLGQTGWG